MELALTGRTFDAAEALQMGMINKVVPEADLKTATQEFALHLAQGPSIAIEMTKRAIHNAWDGDIHSALQFEAFAQEVAQKTEDGAEGPKAFLEKRKPHFKGR
jgi:2-(1,2-epoxy-1,2-dihydrophenyl)acetyl-CoA isomerase